MVKPQFGLDNPGPIKSYLIPCSRHAGPVLYVVPKVHKVYRVEEVEEEKKEEKPEAKSRPKLEEFIIKPVIGNARIGDDASESLMQWLTN